MVKASSKSATANNSTDVIQAHPTKDFFISMLIRDITLKDAIGDLVDNCVDGARSISTTNYNSLYVHITLNKKEFLIEDNCGGFSVDVARKYAFRFGRPSDFPMQAGSIGQFGIGMKRAIFKIGKEIRIESKTKTTSFQMTINVSDWRNDNQNWDFKFDSYSEKENNPRKTWGTKIRVTNLTNDTEEQFSDPTFLTELINEIEKENMYNIHRGLEITINDNKLKNKELFLINNTDIKPAFQKLEVNGVHIRLYAGVGEDNERLGGWYIFCNNRLVVGPEQSNISGWTGKGKDGVATYHHQFSRFRGYVFFDSDNASKLPWNTTKTSMDLDSPLFISIRAKMIEMMKPVITFLNKLKSEREKDNPESNQPLNNLVKGSAESQIAEIDPTPLDQVFYYKSITPRKVQVEVVKISYNIERSKADAVKKYFKISTFKEVGEKTFEYFYYNEID